MKIAMIGLGRMGANMSRRLLRDGHQVVGYDRDEGSARILEKKGLDWVTSLEDLKAALPTPRVVWVMVPAGEPTEEVVRDLADVRCAELTFAPDPSFLPLLQAWPH